MARPFWGNLLFISMCFSGLGLVIAYEFAVGRIPRQLLGVGLLAPIGCLATVIVLRRRVGSSRLDEPVGLSNETPGALRSIRILKAAVVVLPIALILGMWLTRGEPLGPRLTGAAVNLLFTF
jgi:hypothetical protein